jgi:hypothetical protein
MSRTLVALMFVIAVVLLVMSAGCATLPATGAPATGEPLGTLRSSEAYAYLARDKVADVEYRDAAGRSAGSAAVYQDRVVRGVVVHWQPTQGGKVIDDEDFFRIAGDVAAAREIHDYRSQGLWLNRVGLALLATGAGGLVAYRADPGNRYARAVGGASALCLVLGGLWTLDGLYRMKPDHHLFDLGRASSDASDYNERRAFGH